jgi:hypothetical protein
MLNTTPSLRSQVIATLSKFRQEWQEAASEKSLLEVEGNIGLVLADLINSFGLGTQEQTLVLGAQLFEEMHELLYQLSNN